MIILCDNNYIKSCYKENQRNGLLDYTKDIVSLKVPENKIIPILANPIN